MDFGRPEFGRMTSWFSRFFAYNFVGASSILGLGDLHRAMQIQPYKKSSGVLFKFTILYYVSTPKFHNKGLNIPAGATVGGW